MEPLNLKGKILPLVGMALVASAIGMSSPVVQKFEGHKNAAYLDVNGVPTICNGITRGVVLGQHKTDSECADLLKSELTRVTSLVQKSANGKLTVNQLAAFSSFAYNVGDGNWYRSSILKRINTGDIIGACNQLPRWIYVGGRDCRIRANNCYGIVVRRQEEQKLCLMH